MRTLAPTFGVSCVSRREWEIRCGDDSGGSSTGDLEWPPDATACFDEHGVLNADCATDEDCAMVLGYYHAFGRFVQMDIRRRFATGRLADILPKGLAGS